MILCDWHSLVKWLGKMKKAKKIAHVVEIILSYTLIWRFLGYKWQIQGGTKPFLGAVWRVEEYSGHSERIISIFWVMAAYWT